MQLLCQSKPPEHIQLWYGVKTLTENVELIQMLNRLGNGVSFSQLEKNDTALCLQKMAANLNQMVVLPGTYQPNVFPYLAWDNSQEREPLTVLMELPSNPRTITPPYTASSYQQTKSGRLSRRKFSL